MGSSRRRPDRNRRTPEARAGASCTRCHFDIAGGAEPQRPAERYLSAPLVGSERITHRAAAPSGAFCCVGDTRPQKKGRDPIRVTRRDSEKRGTPIWGLPQSPHIPTWRTRHALRFTGSWACSSRPGSIQRNCWPCAPSWRSPRTCSRVLLKGYSHHKTGGRSLRTPSDVI